MKSLTKSELTRRNRYIDGLRELRGKIEDEAATIKDEAFVKLNALVDQYNETLSEARGFIEDLANTMDDYASERSEKWQEGDAGSAYSSWQQEYESIDLDDVEHFEPDLDLGEDFDHADAIEQLPERPEE